MNRARTLGMLALVGIGGVALLTIGLPVALTRGAAAPAPAAPRPGGVLVLGMPQEPDLLNPILSRMRSSNYVAQMIFSYLARTDETGRLVPDLAEAIPDRSNGGIAPDGRTITYRLRRDARWHDGAPVTSADVKFTYDRIIDPEAGAATRHGWQEVQAVEAADPWTVVFRLAAPRAAFIADAFVDEPVLPEHLLRDLSGATFRAAPFHRRPVGSGPFQLESWESGSRLVLRANPAHHGDGPYLDRIVIRFVPDPAALEAQLATGEIHGFDGAEPTAALRIASLPGVTLHRTAGAVFEHLDLNCARPPLDDARVRRALALAIDRRQIARAVYDGVWTPAFADEPVASRFYDPELERLGAADPAEGERLLDKAGWRDADGDGMRERGGRRFELVLTTTAGRPDRERTALLIRDQLKAIGVALAIRPVDPTLFFSSAADGGILQGGDFDLALFAWTAPPDPSVKEAIYSGDFLPPKGQNVTRFQDADVTGLLRRAGAELDASERQELYRRAGRRVAELAPSIPLVWRTQLDPMTAQLRGFRPNPTSSGNSWNAGSWWLLPSAELASSSLP